MQIVPPRVADILRALDGLPAANASALLRQVLVGLDAVERESMRKMLPAANPVLAPTALALLSDPTAMPTLMQREPMPWEPQIENAEFSDVQEPSTTTVNALPVPEPEPVKADTVAMAQADLARMMKRSRYLTAAACAAVLFLIVVGVLCLSLGATEPAPVMEAPTPAAPVVRRRPPPAERESDESLPDLPAAKKRSTTVASASPTPAAAKTAPRAKAEKDQTASWSQWPKGASPRSTKTASARNSAEDDSLTRAWDQR